MYFAPTNTPDNVCIVINPPTTDGGRRVPWSPLVSGHRALIAFHDHGIVSANVAANDPGRHRVPLDAHSTCDKCSECCQVAPQSLS